METLHSYLFPAVGSLKEKRLAHFEPEHTVAKTAVEELEKTVDKHDDPTKEVAVRNEFTAAEAKVNAAKLKVADATDGAAAITKVKDLQGKIDAAKTKFEQKVIEIVNKQGTKWVEQIRTEAVDANKQAKALDFVKPVGPAVPIIEALKNDEKGGKIATMKARTEVLRNIVDEAKGTLSLDRPALLKTASEKVNELETKKAPEAELKIAYGNLRNEAKKVITGAVAAPVNFAALEKTASEVYLAVLDLDKAETYLNKTKPVSTPDPIKEKEAEKAMEAEIKGVIDNKANKASLEALNKAIAGNKDKALAARNAINAKSPDLVYANGTLDKDNKEVWEVRAKAGASSEVEKTLDEASSIKKIIELILKFLSEAGIIKSLDKNKDVSVKDIDNKIVELKADRTKIVADKSDPTGEKVKAIDAEIKALELARPVVVEAAKLGLTVKVDGKGKLVIYSEDESPAGKRRVAMIEDGLHKLPIRFGKNRGTFDFDAINPDQIKMLLNLFAKLAPFIMQRPGMPPNYGFQAPYMPHGYGAFAGAGPNGAIAGVNFGQKPQEFLGAGNSRAAS